MLRKISLKAVLWKKDKNKEGLCPVAISIVGGGERTYYQTSLRLSEADWKDGKVADAYPNYKIYNTRISKMISDTELEIFNRNCNNVDLTVWDVKDMFNPERPRSKFLAMARAVVATKNEPTKRRYGFELDKIKEYAGEEFTVNKITPAWLTGYYKHLVVGNAHNTAINAFKVIRHVLKVNKIEPSPFKYWTYPKYQKPKPKWLTLAECDKLFALLDRPDIGAPMKLVTAFFLLECFAGIRFSDWSNYRLERIVDNNNMLLYTTKTDTPVSIPIDLMPSLSRIMTYIQTNDLKYDKDIGYTNDMLQGAIAGLAGIDKHMTTHLARHTFATTWLSKGLSRSSIARMMGITEKQVDTYAHFDNEQIRNDVQRVKGF